MPEFNYTARDRSGQQSIDSIESESREAAILALRSQGLLPIKITEVKNKGTGASFSLNPMAYRAFNEADIEHEFHQIAVMLRSGISLMDALALTLKHCRLGARSTWVNISKRIEEGHSFTDALREHKAFSDFTIQLIRVGEQTGNLNTVMDEAAREVKSSRELQGQILKALRYPSFTLLMAIGIVFFMLTSLVPEIKKVLALTGKPMPPITKALIDTSNWVVANGLRCHFLGSRKTRFISSLGLLVPISLEIVGFLRSAVFTGAVADMPRRYHYYYFAPVPKSSLQALWDFFIPKTVWPVATHFGCLVLLILGYVSATQNSESA